MSSDYLDMFIEESRENLEALEVGLMRLETESAEDMSATIRELFRFAHNMKGMAATVGQDGITALAHRMEDLLDLFRNNVATPTADAVDELLAGADAIGGMLSRVPSGEVPAAPQDLLAKLEARLEALVPADSESPSSTPPPAEVPVEVEAPTPTPAPAPDADPVHPTAVSGPAAGAVRFEVKLKDGAALPGARSAVVIKAVENTGAVLATEPDRDTILAGRVSVFSVDAAVQDAEAMATKLRGLTDVESVTVVDSGKNTEQTTASPTSTSGSAASRQTVRVEVERLDDLMNLVGELVIGRGQLEQRVRALGDRSLGDVVTGLSRTISDLQSAVGRARMITLDGTFSRLQRLVRDTSRDLDKDIAFTMSGSETELDRSMIDKVADPLVHLLRNALDHGIENREHGWRATRTLADRSISQRAPRATRSSSPCPTTGPASTRNASPRRPSPEASSQRSRPRR